MHTFRQTGAMQYSTSRDPGRRYTAFMWNKNERDGKFEELKGQAKQAAGKATGNAALVDEGRADEVAGKTQGAVGTATRKVGEAVTHVGNAIKKS